MMNKKRLTVIMMTACMVFTMMPSFAFAEGEAAADAQAGAAQTAQTGSGLTAQDDGASDAYNDEIPSTPENGIPVIVINADEQELTEEDGEMYGSIDDMNNSEDHSVRCHGSVSLMTPSGYSGGYGGSVLDADDAGSMELSYIRGRGNSTWTVPSNKKPYKLKFKSEQNFFGMGASKEWALMAGYYDGTLMKNRITSWLGQQMDESAFVPQMVPVDLYMRGDSFGTLYLGSYCLSETVDVEENRLALSKLKKSTGESEGDNITGGYLITYFSFLQNSDEPDETLFSTDAGIELINKEPSYGPDELSSGQEMQRTYIREYIQEIENLILKPGTTDGSIDEETHNKIAALMDLDSFADYWLIQEFCYNLDAFETSSTYFFKEKDSKLCWGPLWDFDGGWGTSSDEEDESEIIVDDHICSFNNTEMQWIDALRENDPLFREILKSRWKIMSGKLEELTKDEGIIDAYADEVSESEAADDEKYSDERYSDKTYEDKIDYLKRWTNSRRKWIDENINNVGEVHVNVTYKADDEVIRTDCVRKDHTVKTSDMPDAPEKDGYVFTEWIEAESGESAGEFIVKEDTVFTPKYMDEADVIAPKAIYFMNYEQWVSLSADKDLGLQEPEIYPEDVTSDKMTWSSSDTDVATVSNTGDVTLVGEGDAYITAEMYNGVKNSYLLHVYDENSVTAVTPTSMTPVSKELALDAGDTEQIRVSFGPEGKVFKWLEKSYQSSDEDVAEVSFSGVVTAKKNGTAVIMVAAKDPDDEDPDAASVLTASVRVTVGNGAAVKAANPMTVTPKTVKLKRSTLKKKSVRIARKKAFWITKAKGTRSYKKVGINKSKKKYYDKFKVNAKTGKITVKRGLKKGTYKLRIKVTAAGTDQYKAVAKTVKVTIRVK